MNNTDLIQQINHKKTQFKEPVVASYYNVVKLLNAEDEIIQAQSQLDQLIIDPGTTESEEVDMLRNKIVELQLKHDKIQHVINNDMGSAVPILFETLDACKLIKNVDCGHPEYSSTVDGECTRCKQKDEKLKLARKKMMAKWVQTITPLSKFTVLFFYRGTWCGNCPLYLRQVNDCMKDIRSMGGEVYAICSQEQQFVDQMKETAELDFDLISDTKCELGKKYNLKISKKGGYAFKVMQRIIRSALKTSDFYDSSHDDGITQPAVVVLDNQSNIIYKWVTPASLKSGYGMFDRIEPVEVMDVLKFHFSHTDLVTSVTTYCSENSAQVFSMTMGDPTLRALFAQHLRNEFSSESIEFLDEVEDFIKSLNKNKNLVKKMKDREYSIYSTYIPEQAPKELNLPHELRTTVSKELSTELSPEDHVFNDVSEFVRRLLQCDSFSRFVKKRMFVDAAVTLIPQIMSLKRSCITWENK